MSTIRKYHNHTLQASPRRAVSKSHRTPGRQLKQSNQPSPHHQDDCKARRTQKPNNKTRTKQRTLTNHGSNNESTEPNSQNGQQPKPPGREGRGLNAFYLHKTFALDSIVAKGQNLFSSHVSFQTMTLYHHRETKLIYGVHFISINLRTKIYLYRKLVHI